MTEPMLEVQGLNAWYGESHVLHGLSLKVNQGEVVTLLGRNGAGKSTTLKSIIGMMKRRAGSIKFCGDEVIAAPSRRIARAGVGFVPEDRGIFAGLNVLENLRLPPLVQGTQAMSEAEIFELFPNLAERLQTPARKLSGGEQQMLSIARILRAGPRLILLDEPTEGLAPAIIKQIAKVVKLMKARGLTLVLVEQNLDFALPLADRHYVIEEGRVVDMIHGTDTARARINKYLSL